MNFRPELAAKVMDGTKTATRRLVSANPRSPWYRHSTRWPAGKRFAVCPGRSKDNIGHARVVAARVVHLGTLTDDEARAEGFESAADFAVTWAVINKSYDAHALVWRIDFEAERTA